MKVSKKKNIIFICLLVLPILVWVLIDYAIRPYIRKDNKVWENDSYFKRDGVVELPKYDELSDYEGYRFYKNLSYHFPFSFRLDQFEKAYLLEVVYREEIFQEKLVDSLAQYQTFGEEEGQKLVANHYLPCLGGRLKNYEFKVVTGNEKKGFISIFWNKKKNVIRYLQIHGYSLSEWDTLSYLTFTENSFRLDW